jgi:hypothetical protein
MLYSVAPADAVCRFPARQNVRCTSPEEIASTRVVAILSNRELEANLLIVVHGEFVRVYDTIVIQVCPIEFFIQILFDPGIHLQPTILRPISPVTVMDS